MDKYLINNNYTISGIWFIPGTDKEDDIYSGILEYNPLKSVSLLKLWTNNEANNKTLQDTSIINGISEGKLITIINTRCISIQHSLLTVYEFSIYGSIIIGKHYNKEEEINFKEIYYRFSGLSELCNYNKANGNIKDNGIHIDYKKPEDIVLLEMDGVKHRICHSFRTIPFGRNTEIHANEYIEIKYRDPCSLRNLLNNINIINNFLIFNLNSESSLINISAKDDNDIVQILNPYYRKFSLNENSKWMAVSRIYETTDKEFVTFYQKWVSLYEKEKKVFDKYFELLKIDKYFIEEEFILKTQLFEELHRKTNSFIQNNDSSEMHQNRLDKILFKCPEEYEEWLENRLLHSNEITFSNRIKNLYKEMELYFNKYLKISNGNMVRIIYKINKTRNFMTHGSIESEKDAELNPEKLIFLNNILKTMIDYIILSNLDFNTEMIRRAIFRKPTFYGMLHNVNNGNIDWKRLKYIEK